MFDEGLRLDILVEKKVIIEIKSVAEIHDIHFAQVLTYLKVATNVTLLVL